jgi:hypothetical protein
VRRLADLVATIAEYWVLLARGERTEIRLAGNHLRSALGETEGAVGEQLTL